MKESVGSVSQDSKAKGEEAMSAAPVLDPIVQQFGQLSKDKTLEEEEEDDRPYDPEEEYNPERAFHTLIADPGRHHDVENVPETAEKEEVAYDPEDETILEEAKVTIDDLPNRMCVKASSTERPADFTTDATNVSLVEQQKMLEELNKQIEEQKRQLEEQEEALRQQRAAVGVAMAHFSVSDALMSPPPKSSLAKTDLFSQEQQAPDPSHGALGANPSLDSRQSRDPRQARRLAAENIENEPLPRAPTGSTPGPQGTLPARETTVAGIAAAQGPGLAPEAKEPVAVPWAPGENTVLRPEHDIQKCEHPGNPVSLPLDSSHLPTAGDGRPAAPRRVLLPTPPSTAFPPSFPLHPEEAKNFSSGGREPFPGPVFLSQETSLGSSQFEDARGAQSAGRSESPVADTEDSREPQPRPGEGTTPFPQSGQRGGGPQPQFPGQREPLPRTFGMSGHHGPGFPGPRGPVPPFSEENIVPNNDGPRGPSPAKFGAQKPPIPSLFSGQHGPPPYGDNRGLSPSYLGGPRGGAPAQFEERKDPHGENREFQDASYNEMTGGPAQCEGPDQAPFMGNRAPFQFGGQRRPLLTQMKGPRGGPPPSQFGGQRGPPPGHFVGPRGPHPSQFETSRGPHPGQFEGPRGQAPGFMPGPRGVQPQQFEEQRVNSPPRFAGQRVPLPYGGPRGSAPFAEKNEQPPRFHFQGPSSQPVKPPPRPLLELPSHHPQHRKDRWDEAGPATALPSNAGPGQGPETDGQWGTSEFREGKGHEYRNPAFEGRQRERFESGPKEKPLDEPDAQGLENRQGRAFEDRRRERERGRNWSRERDWERSREWDRHREWDKGRDRSSNRDRERDTDRAKEWDRNRERIRNRDRDRERRRDRDRSRSRDRDRDRERTRDRDRDRGRKDRSKSRESPRDLKSEARTSDAGPAAAQA